MTYYNLVLPLSIKAIINFKAMKNQLLIPGGILIALLYLTGCGENNSNSTTIAPVETSNPTSTDTPISQASSTQKLAPGTYCYTAKTETLDADAEITINPQKQVNGTVNATIQNEAQGYYSSYNQTLKGTLEEEKAKLDIVTKIELDTQKAQETWTITESSLNSGRETFDRVDCATLAQGNSIKPVRINFAKGSTSKTVSNSVIRGTRDTYLVGANKEQQMNLNITSLENNAVFDVVSPDGKTLKEEATNWSKTLPANGDYQIVVGGTRGNATYELTTEIK